MKAVTMLKAHRSLNAGEVAGFPEEEADRLILAGVAEALGDAKPAPEPKPAKAPKPAPEPKPAETPADQPAPGEAQS